MSNEKSISEMSKPDLLKLRDELGAAKKREEVELSRLNSEYQKFGRAMSQETYNATVTMQQDCKTRLAFITDSQIEVKGALRAISDYEYEEQQHRGATVKDMTMRDYFAAKAMQALTQSEQFLREASEWRKIDGEDVEDAIAGSAYDLADAMLKARE